MENEVFLSYHPSERLRAGEIGLSLCTEGLHTFWEHEGTRPAIENLSIAKCVVVLWSHLSITSEIVLRQAKYALERRRLVCAFLDDVELKPPFTREKKFMLESPHDRQSLTFASLANAVRQTVARSDAEIIPLLKDEPDAEAVTPKIFLCYRRDDSEESVGRLYDWLSEKYGRENVFMDVERAPAGRDFVHFIDEQISQSDAVIVAIGRQWTSVFEQRRKQGNEDHVRSEVVAALRRSIPVIPVFVQDATLPIPEELPEEIRPLVRRTGLPLRTRSWGADVERLIKELDRAMKPSDRS